MQNAKSRFDDGVLPSREVECDRLRRRRFLQLAMGSLGAAALGSNLAGALQQGGGPPEPKGDCTTTETYTRTFLGSFEIDEETRTHTFSTTTPFRPTSVSYTATATAPESYMGTRSGTFENASETGSFSETVSDNHPGTLTWSQSCSGGTLSVTYSHPSFGSYTWRRTVSETGIHTVTCVQGGFLREVEPWRLRASPLLPPTLDANASVLLARTRARFGHRVPELG